MMVPWPPESAYSIPPAWPIIPTASLQTRSVSPIARIPDFPAFPTASPCSRPVTPTFDFENRTARAYSPASSVGSHASGISHPPGSRKRRRTTFADVSSADLLKSIDDWDDGRESRQVSNYNGARLKENRCEEGCDKSFHSKSALRIHRETVHDDRSYKCFGKSCTTPDMLFPRLDHFKAHIRRQHGDENEKHLLNLSQAWYEETKLSVMSKTRRFPPRRSSSSPLMRPPLMRHSTPTLIQGVGVSSPQSPTLTNPDSTYGSFAPSFTPQNRRQSLLDLHLSSIDQAPGPGCIARYEDGQSKSLPGIQDVFGHASNSNKAMTEFINMARNHETNREVSNLENVHSLEWRITKMEMQLRSVMEERDFYKEAISRHFALEDGTPPCLVFPGQALSGEADKVEQWLPSIATLESFGCNRCQTLKAKGLGFVVNT